MEAATPGDAPLARKDVFPFLGLPRELRDQIYDYAFALQDDRGDRSQRIERRHLRHFKPSAATILLLLHREYFLLNRQVAREALEILLDNHTVFLSCGPYVLKQILTKIENSGAPGRQYLNRMNKIELDWITFPNLRDYPPERSENREWWYEYDTQEVDVDYIRGAQYNGHYDEHDYEGGYYDDNIYGAEDNSLYPSWPGRNRPSSNGPTLTDPFGFSTHYPFADPLREPAYDVSSAIDIDSKLGLLVDVEVTPLFRYFSTPTFSISSITLPLYFISKSSHRNRTATRPGYTLPLKIRYWVRTCIQALLMLHQTPTLQEVRIKYMPWDVWASMEPADDLQRMAEKGVMFKESDGPSNVREGEGEAFRALWAGLEERGVITGEERLGLSAKVQYVKWEGEIEQWRIGDELEVVFTKDVGGSG